MDHASGHTARITKKFIVAKSISVIENPPYSPNLALVDFFLLPTAKEILGGITITCNMVKKDLEGVCSTIPKEAFAHAFEKWVDHCKACIERDGDYVEK